MYSDPSNIFPIGSNVSKNSQNCSSFALLIASNKSQSKHLWVGPHCMA